MIAETLDAERLARVYARHVNRTHAIMAAALAGGHAEVAAEGSIVFDEEGGQYLDCGGQGVFLLGHRHPTILDAVRAQLDLQPLQTRYLLDPPLAEAAAALARVTPDGLDYVAFVGSGSEAVELALKLTQLAGRSRLVTAEGGFHGTTLGALGLTATPGRDPSHPLPPGAARVPFGDAEALAAVLSESPGECAVVLEPVQCEAGVRIPPRGYMKTVERLCREHAALLVLDEVQTGLGRLGRWWGAAFDEVRPDVLVSGTVLGGGVLPVGAVVATDEVWAPLNRDPRLHSSTFANAPILAAAACATIEVLETTDAIERSAVLGAWLLDELRAAAPAGVVADVRGIGLMIALELASPPLADALRIELLRERILPSHSANDSATVRLTPSALLDELERRWLVDGVSRALAAVAER